VISVNGYSDAILKRVSATLEEFDYDSLERVVDLILRADRIFVVGRGRSDLVAKSFAYRLLDLGIRGFVVGESITPSTTKNDCLIAISGSGETVFTLNAARLAKQVSAQLVVFTSYPDSPLGKLSDLVVRIKGRRKGSPEDPDYMARQITGAHEPFDTSGIVFEVSTMIVLESGILELYDRISRE